MFLNLKPIKGGKVAFGGMGKGKISGIGKIVIPSLASTDNVLYVNLRQWLYCVFQQRPVNSQDTR